MSQQTKKSSNSNMTTITVALVLCLVCSVMVSAVAVGLKPAQVENQLLDRNKNILVAAGLFDPAKDTNEDVEKRFADFDVKLVDLEKGEYATEADLSKAGITDVNNYDANQAAKNKALSTDLGNDDPASIGAVPKFAKVYVKNDANGKPELMVLPVHGYGLWGTMYGFLTLEGDLNTVKGISWYDHKETPGLGARIEEPKWRAQWEGIHAYDENGEVATGVTKAGQSRENWVDGISGATLTSVGVRNLIQFWLGERGYKPFLDNLRGGTPDSAANAQTETTTGEEA
ncbi:Na(+)-translocating NADH-quinone reductase subunit C [Psychrobacter phenylpyruvicus]|uniref:Na(+)-translocating NADH-quinone reductase subunit C n=1 Tax=Psychrobacter phenylpyruvicus TaxID=29432 RepID=A0A379LN10_9GAMM|nr:Na(+)-translocating NADH-quinone reductase subunit C [Psychrobacter phenylpyruvicus]SUD91986.1 Na(+)-translocating NADH-quinone reductase subunit C [Psychrobacter phenylpyruvicus]